jgi:hypothetical protein
MWPGFNPISVHVGFVVYQVTLGRVFSEYFGSPANFYFISYFTYINHPIIIRRYMVSILIASLNNPLKPKVSHVGKANYTTEQRIGSPWCYVYTLQTTTVHTKSSRFSTFAGPCLVAASNNGDSSVSVLSSNHELRLLTHNQLSQL